MRFKYRLEGRDTAWTEAGDERVAHYSATSRRAIIVFTSSPATRTACWTTTRRFAGHHRAAAILADRLVSCRRHCVFSGLIIAIVRYLSTQKLQRQLQLLKQHEALEKERARIARDLHDQLGANLTQVALLGEMAEADKHPPAEIESHAQQISQTARETTRSLDEIVWAVNPANDTLDGLVNYACKYAQEYLALAGLRYRADLPAHLPANTIPPEVRHNVFLAFKEAVNNVVKHAQASEVRIRLRLDAGKFHPGN